jgi:hypothetical protein
MLWRAIATVLLLSGLYADAQLYGAKRVIVQCVRLGNPCGRDLGYLDHDGRFHPKGERTDAWAN